jgi:hypothetical protein
MRTVKFAMDLIVVIMPRMSYFPNSFINQSVIIVRSYGPDESQQWQEGFLYSTMSCPALKPIQSYICGMPGAFPRVKLPGHEANHTLPSSAEVKNCGDICPLHNISSWHGAELIKHRSNFEFSFLLCFLCYCYSRIVTCVNNFTYL